MVATGFIAAGCTYSAPTNVNPATNIYSNYDDKLQGRYALYVDAEKLKEDIKPSGLACSAHTFPVDARSAFRTSTIKTFENLIEEVEPVDQPLTQIDLTARGLRGMIVVEVDDIDIDLKVIPGFWTSEIEADAEITAQLTVDGTTGRLLGTAVEGEEDARSEAGGACEGGAAAIGEAVEEAMKEVLERLGERLTNSQRLRNGV